MKDLSVNDTSGIIAFQSPEKQFKATTAEYSELFNARGNEPSVKFRYLQVRMNGDVRDALYYLYPPDRDWETTI